MEPKKEEMPPEVSQRRRDRASSAPFDGQNMGGLVGTLSALHVGSTAIYAAARRALCAASAPPASHELELSCEAV